MHRILAWHAVNYSTKQRVLTRKEWTKEVSVHYFGLSELKRETKCCNKSENYVQQTILIQLSTEEMKKKKLLKNFEMYIVQRFTSIKAAFLIHKDMVRRRQVRDYSNTLNNKWRCYEIELVLFSSDLPRNKRSRARTYIYL